MLYDYFVRALELASIGAGERPIDIRYLEFLSLDQAEQLAGICDTLRALMSRKGYSIPLPFSRSVISAYQFGSDYRYKPHISHWDECLNGYFLMLDDFLAQAPTDPHNPMRTKLLRLQAAIKEVRLAWEPWRDQSLTVKWDPYQRSGARPPRLFSAESLTNYDDENKSRRESVSQALKSGAAAGVDGADRAGADQVGQKKLIFVESHEDTATPNILWRIIPYLADLGYKTFFDEQPAGADLTDIMAQCETDRIIWKRACSTFGIPSDISIEQQRERLLNTRVGSDALIKRFLHHEMFSNACAKLKKHGIDYCGIDSLVVKRMDVRGAKEHEYRDKRMAYRYLTQPYVFGRCGLAHALGLQKNILASGIYASPEEAKQDYIFVYAYSESPVNELESQIRYGRIKFPLDLHRVNISDSSETMITAYVEAILRRAREQCVPSSQLSMKARTHITQWLSRFDNVEKRVRLYELPLGALYYQQAKIEEILSHKVTEIGESGLALFKKPPKEPLASQQEATTVAQEALICARTMEAQFRHEGGEILGDGEAGSAAAHRMGISSSQP